ncbi:hypothetical protein RRG08_039448 [Elysia crispata]|uniref:Integrase catalytic domain-containing protein n=1 Tax=Elysia crispata TaxID=231223 RepID=A0AAE1ABC5_9GAST|nr:hypothetical protein RRG08_039448 [Elysia crispata]
MDVGKHAPNKNIYPNVVDCYSRFAFGAPTKGKSATEMADALLHFIYMYLYGTPRILQTDNGREFNNEDLTEVIRNFQVRKMNGRPYHPQSQGRVERFNQTVWIFLKKTIFKNPAWSDQLEEFYYNYNNRINKATQPSTRYEKFFGRPNFSTTTAEMVSPANLTPKERVFERLLA